MIVVAALYKFTKILDCSTLKLSLSSLLFRHHIKGTIIIANEGINGTIAGSREAINEFKAFLLTDDRFKNTEYKESITNTYPFKRLLIKIKQEIVTLGRPDVNPTEASGVYVDAAKWNQLLNDPEVTVIDVRNDFEVQLGTFKNAINPQTEAFSDFPQFVKNKLSPTIHKKIAMSCTGGIRCEKASSLMKQMGFLEVYHLKGGVLQYLQDVPREESLWQGDCFVFDERRTLDHDLNPPSSSLI